jgi:hypothetical protein
LFRPCTGRACPSQHFNAPVENPSQADPDEVEVTDPTHPLFGRRFQIRSIHRSSLGLGQVSVVYRDSLQLCIPLAATNLAVGRLPIRRTKWTQEVIGELLFLVKEWNILCPGTFDRSGGGSRKQ